MIAVTGAAGFIGSNIVCELNRQGRDDLLAVDVHDTDAGNANLAPLRYERYLAKDEFLLSFTNHRNEHVVGSQVASHDDNCLAESC